MAWTDWRERARKKVLSGKKRLGWGLGILRRLGRRVGRSGVNGWSGRVRLGGASLRDLLFEGEVELW